MTTTYENELAAFGDTAELPDPATPAGEAMRWWLSRVQQMTYVGPRNELPSGPAASVLRGRELIAETAGRWAFAIRGPHIGADTALRRNLWALVRVALDLYAPAALDRGSAIRLAVGDETAPSEIDVRHGANRSEHRLVLVDDHTIVLRPDAALQTFAGDASPRGHRDGPIEVITTVVGGAPPITLTTLSAAQLLTAVRANDLRQQLDPILVWLRTLAVGRDALERAYARDPHPVLLKRMADLARDVGNLRLASTIDEVVSAHNRSQLSRTLTRVGREFIVPRYIVASPPASSPWLERHRARIARALDAVEALVRTRRPAVVPASADVTLAFARAAKADDTYHSTTIEGYYITPDEVQAVLQGRPYGGRTPQEIERLMALKGYAQAFDWTLARIRESAPPLAMPMLSESLLLDLFVELWGPSLDAGIVEVPALRAWRTHPVQIKGSAYVPPAAEKLSALMTQYVAQLSGADVSPLTRAIVGHWQFVHIHPFRDGNGRIARLLMNYVLGAAGLPWTTIRVEERLQYFATLERAHVHDDVVPFATFIADAIDRASVARSVAIGSRLPVS